MFTCNHSRITKNRRYRPPLSRVCHSHTHTRAHAPTKYLTPQQLRHRQRPYLSVKSCFHLNRTKLMEMEWMQVAGRRESMHARSCETDGDFTLISLAHHAQPRLPPHRSLLPPYRQTLSVSSFLFTPPLPILSPSFVCSSSVT